MFARTGRLLALLASLPASAACAQTAAPLPSGFPDIPTSTHPSPPAEMVSRHEFVCTGQDYLVQVRQSAREGPTIREVRVEQVSGPSGSLVADDLRRLDDALAPFVLVFAVTPQCQGNAVGLTFSGRLRADARDSSVTVWLENGQISRLD